MMGIVNNKFTDWLGHQQMHEDSSGATAALALYHAALVLAAAAVVAAFFGGLGHDNLIAGAVLVGVPTAAVLWQYTKFKQS